VIRTLVLFQIALAAMASTGVARAEGLQQTPSQAAAPTVAQMHSYLSAIARDVDSFWSAAFKEGHMPYTSPKVVLVDAQQSVRTPCSDQLMSGTLENSFWCSRDQRVYLFVKFLTTMYRQQGDFAVAYVVAHEWGHHVQGQLGIWKTVAQRHLLTIQTETQADCFAGVWARSAFDRGVVDQSELQQIIAATDFVGDAQGVPTREQGAHGQSGLRSAWFLNGFRRGDVGDCKTF
jgi:predicted metalloprotease